MYNDEDRKKAQIVQVIRDWYACNQIEPTVQTREDEIDEFESDHPEVPEFLWRFVNHATRQVHMWSKMDLNYEIVVWEEQSQSYRLVQDICFKDAYPTVVEWYTAIKRILENPYNEVWIARCD